MQPRTKIFQTITTLALALTTQSCVNEETLLDTGSIVEEDDGAQEKDNGSEELAHYANHKKRVQLNVQNFIVHVKQYTSIRRANRPSFFKGRVSSRTAQAIESTRTRDLPRLHMNSVRLLLGTYETDDLSIDIFRKLVCMHMSGTSLQRRCFELAHELYYF